jgi:orotate phosphoribosyltransferase
LSFRVGGFARVSQLLEAGLQFGQALDVGFAADDGEDQFAAFPAFGVFDELDAIGGLTMGADPVAFGIASVAATRGRALRSFSVRKEAKDHGVTGRIAGALSPGDRVAIVEDTVTRGTSLFEAVEVVREFGAYPVFITVIVDRGGPGASLAEAAGIAYVPMLTAPDLGYRFGT